MSQQQYQQGGQQMQPTFDQYLPQQVSQAIYQLELLETDAEWAHGQAMQVGDVQAADTLADVADAVHLQKKLLLRESSLASTFGQCTQQALQQCTQKLQAVQTPGAQQVAQKAQQVAQEITQASQQVAQGSQGMGQQQQIGQQPQQIGQQPQQVGQQPQQGGAQQVGGQQMTPQTF